MGSRSYEKAASVSGAGVTVHQLYTDSEFEVPSIVLKLVSNRDEPVFVRLVVPNVETERVGFHPGFKHDSWSLDQNTIVFETEINPQSDVTTLYAVDGGNNGAIEAAIDNLQIETVESLATPNLDDSGSLTRSDDLDTTDDSDGLIDEPTDSDALLDEPADSDDLLDESTQSDNEPGGSADETDDTAGDSTDNDHFLKESADTDDLLEEQGDADDNSLGNTDEKDSSLDETAESDEILEETDEFTDSFSTTEFESIVDKEDDATDIDQESSTATDAESTAAIDEESTSSSEETEIESDPEKTLIDPETEFDNTVDIEENVTKLEEVDEAADKAESTTERSEAQATDPDSEKTQDKTGALSAYATENLIAELTERLAAEELTQTQRRQLQNAIDERADARDEQIRHLQSRMSDIETYTETIERLFEQHGPPDELFAEYDQRMETLEQRLGEMESTVETTEATVEGVKTTVDSVETTVEDVEGNLSDVERRVDDVETTVEQRESVVDDVETVKENQQTIKSEMEDIKRWRKKITGALKAFMDE